MSNSAQRRLSFPVRKNTRQRRTESLSRLKTLELQETDCSPLRRSKRNTVKISTIENCADNIPSKLQSPMKITDSAGPLTPVRKPRQRRQQPPSDSSSVSPVKRKSENIPSPPTPPKSPCKLVARGKESAEPSHSGTPKGKDHALANNMSPVKSGDFTDIDRLVCSNSPKRHIKILLPSIFSNLKSPSKCRSEIVPPPPTPPKSPFSCKNKHPEGGSPLSPRRPHGNKLLTQALPQSPRKTARDENGENFVLRSPKKPGSLQVHRPDSRPYQGTKQLLHTAKPDLLVGRDHEVSQIKDFLTSHLEEHSAGSLYISGAPGTGKTAALLHIIDSFKTQYRCAIGYLNCMTVKDAASVYRKLHSELSGKASSTGRTAKDMEKLVTSSKDSLILVLDEIDQLDSKNQEVLYRIFEWPYLACSKLILIGIANALDLTDRILPRLQAKPHCRPVLLHFAPYTRDQIAAIISNRLTQCKDGDAVIENSAVQFCARKVSAVAGDMRKALDVCRRAVELVESEVRSQQVLRVADCNSPSKNHPPVKKIGIPHISKVLSEVYGSSVQVQQSEGVPLQQKLLVCTLLLVVKSGKFKEVQLGKVYESYCKVCRRQQMASVDQSEFHSLCVLLEARGIIGMKKAKDTRLIKLTLRQDEKELEQTLQDRVLVSTILKEGLPK